jgi:hypothetical protein
MTLHRIAISLKREFTDWQYRLATIIPANAVANIFYFAKVREEDGALIFKDSSLAARAEQWRQGVEKIFGKGIKIEAEAAAPPAIETGRPRVHIRVT